MSKKSYKYDKLGDKRCVVCGRKLKKRIEIEHPTFDKCYRCFKGLPPRNSDVDEIDEKPVYRTRIGWHVNPAILHVKTVDGVGE